MTHDLLNLNSSTRSKSVLEEFVPSAFFTIVVYLPGHFYLWSKKDVSKFSLLVISVTVKGFSK